jgi:hypothetical protein
MGARSMTNRRRADYDAVVADELNKAISLRLSDEDVALLDMLSKRFPMKKLTIARIALRLGLTELDRNPAAIFQADTPADRKSEPKPKKR